MKTIHFFYSVCISVILFACNSGSEDTSDVPDDKSDSVNLLARTDSTLEVSGKAAQSMMEWLAFIQPEYKLSPDSFSLTDIWMEDSLITEPFKPDSTYFPLYGKYLRYAPDSAYFIDLDSYNIILQEANGVVTGMEAGPDLQIYLVDKNNQIRKRLMFNGPGYYVQDAWWIDNESVLLASIAETDSVNRFEPVLWKINIVEDLFEKYEYKGAFLKAFPQYVEKVRFSEIRVR
jgi:hypothetical protein